MLPHKVGLENFLTEKMLLQKEIEKMTDKKPAHIKIASVIAEAKEIKEMTAREDVCCDNAISPLIFNLSRLLLAARQLISPHLCRC